MNEQVKADKFRRYRERKRANGMRQVRLWLPDVNSASFREQIAREAALINASTDERAAMAMAEAMLADIDWVYKD